MEAVRYDGANWTVLDTDWFDSISALAIDHDDVKWFGTYQGIYSYDGDFIKENPLSVQSRDIRPDGLTIQGIYPNPFNPRTTVEFMLPEPGFANLVIYNIMGQKVRELVSENLPAGCHRAVWNGVDDRGTPVSSGLYISNLKMGNKTASKRMLLVK